ncbi:MAG: hypothetical protein V1779_15535 [bacterium]
MTSLIVSPANNQEFILLMELFKKMKIEFKTLSNNIDDVEDSSDWHRFAMFNLSRAYSNDEPEYTSNMIKEPNPDYDPFFESKL